MYNIINIYMATAEPITPAATFSLVWHSLNLIMLEVYLMISYFFFYIYKMEMYFLYIPERKLLGHSCY